MTIFDFPEYLPKEKQKEKPKEEKPIGCFYSGHECNKQELWSIADTLDDIKCQKVCCRKCSETLCGARCNGASECKWYTQMNGFDFIPYIISTLLNNSLLEPFTSALIDGLKAVDDWVYAKEVPEIFEHTLFKLTNTQYFECKGEHFYIRKANDNPPFKKCGVLYIHHCGKDNEYVLANVLAQDIGRKLMEKVKGEIPKS